MDTGGKRATGALLGVLGIALILCSIVDGVSNGFHGNNFVAIFFGVMFSLGLGVLFEREKVNSNDKR